MSIQRGKAILITGMHRSGTSALAGVVNLLGADAGSGLLPAVHGDNERGYWEIGDVVALNNECLEHFGLSWSNPGPLPDHWLDDPWLEGWQKRTALLLQQRFAAADLIMIKDPRLSRLLPAWRRVLEDADIQPLLVIPLRHPLEVVASLLRRPDTTLDTVDAHRLWLRYLIDAEASSRDLPRTWIRYDRLLEDWRLEMRRLADDLSIVWPKGVDAASPSVEKYLDSNLRNQRLEQQVADNQNATIRASCEAYRKLAQSLESGKDVGAALREFDQAERALLAAHEKSRDSVRTTAVSRGPLETEPGAWLPPEFLRMSSCLYYRQAHQTYASERSVVVEAVPEGLELVARFILPENVTLDSIRFDPTELPGIYRLFAIAVDGQNLPIASSAVTTVRDRKLEALHDELVRFVCVDSDPWVEFDLRRVLNAHPREITVRFWRESPVDAVREAIARESRNVAVKQAQLAERLTRLETTVSESIRHAEAASKAAWAEYLAQASGLADLRAIGRTLIAVAWHDVELLAQLPGQSPKVWAVCGEDSSFQLNMHGKPLNAGWYVMSLVLSPLSGVLHKPLLYVDYGEGFSEESVIPLPLANNSRRHRLLLKFEHQVHGLRLDPSAAEGPCHFIFADPSIRRIGRPEAMLRLAWPAIQRMRASGATSRRIMQEIRASLRRGPATALDTLHANACIADNTYQSISYADWIKANDTLDDAERTLMRADIDSMAEPPLISIILPVYNTPEPWLRACLDSVVRQIYPHWELCIANDASTEPQVRRVLKEYSAGDARIKVMHRETNGHISAASNSALELATGLFIALLDHDDELPEHALYHVAKAIETHPGVRVIYSDEDKIDELGTRFDPYFKPDWNPELFLCQNMVSHLGVYSAELVRSIRGFREGYEGSQDHDLALRASEKIEAHEILHIPRILYHWRAIAGSTAVAVAEKDYVRDASRRAVADHLARIGARAQVTLAQGGYLRIAYELPSPKPTVSVIIPTRDGLHLLRKCVDSVLKHTEYSDFEVIIVDNQSRNPETLKWLEQIQKRDSRTRVLRIDEPFNFARLNNQAVARAHGDILVLLNNDIEVTQKDWLSEMVSHASRSHVGAVGAKLYYPDGTIQHAGVIIGFGGVAGHAYSRKPHDHIGQMGRAKLTQNMSAVTAACLAVRKTAYLEVGGMNEDLGVAFNDVDFCLRLLEVGYRNVWTPHAEFVHHESATRGEENTSQKLARFKSEVERMQRIWGPRLALDPAYNPNLCLQKEPFRISSQPTTDTRLTDPHGT